MTLTGLFPGGLWGSFCMDEEKGAGKSHATLKNFVDSNPPKPKDLKMIQARA